MCTIQLYITNCCTLFFRQLTLNFRMSNPQRSRPSSTKRDSTGSVGQNRLIDLANVPASSTNSTNQVEAGEGQVSRNSSFSKEAAQTLPDSRPSTPQSQTHEAPSSSNSGGIDIPSATGREGSQTGGAGGGSSSSGGEHQSPSLMSVLQSPSSPPSMSYLSSLSPGPSPAGPGPGGAGQRGGSSSSSDMSGAVFTGILPGSPLNDQSFGSLPGCTVPTSSMLNASGEDGR